MSSPSVIFICLSLLSSLCQGKKGGFLSWEVIDSKILGSLTWICCPKFCVLNEIIPGFPIVQQVGHIVVAWKEHRSLNLTQEKEDS